MMNLDKPLIAATVHLHGELSFLPALAGEEIIDAVEFRADKFYRGETQKLADILSRIKQTRLPVICTFRGGEIPGLSEQERLGIIGELLHDADAVDIELSSEITEQAVAKAKGLLKTVIVSEHDFTSTPPCENLEKIFQACAGKGADIVKMALMPQTPRDAGRLMKFCLDTSAKHPVICISMGEMGKFTRFFAPFFGSVMTYGCISSPVAPGQVNVRELKRELGKYF